MKYLSSGIENRIIKHLSKFTIIVEDTINAMEPKLIAKYAYELATLFNNFYEKQPILKEIDNNTSSARISLVEAVRRVLEVNLCLVGITPLNRM